MSRCFKKGYYWLLLCDKSLWQKTVNSENFLFRYQIRGIKHILFYELPHYSTFYSDILNYMDTRKTHSDSQINPVTCTVLYTKSNALRLAGVVGAQRCSHMISSDKDVHMFVTGDDEAWMLIANGSCALFWIVYGSLWSFMDYTQTRSNALKLAWAHNTAVPMSPWISAWMPQMLSS